MTLSLTKNQPFRCPIQPDQADGTLKIGRKKIAVKLSEASLEGFTLIVSKANAKTLRHDKNWTLTTKNEKALVHPEWMFNSRDGDFQLGVRRLDDLTPAESPPTSARMFSRMQLTSSLSGPALAGMIFLIIGMLCLPGVGDDLGTAPKVQSVLRDTFHGISHSLRRFITS